VNGPNCFVSGTNSGTNSGSSNSGSNTGSNTGSTGSNTNTTTGQGQSVLSPSTGGALVNIGPMIDGWTTKAGFYLSDGVKIALLALILVIVLGGIALGIFALARRRKKED
jgi:hypothetical protein